MIAAKSEYMNEASETIYRMSADDQIRKMCRDREEYYLDIRSYQTIIAENEKTIAEKDTIIKQLLAEVELLKNKQQRKKDAPSYESKIHKKGHPIF